MAAPPGETPLQRETRLTGNEELLQAVDATLQVLMGTKSNSVLSRKVVGRWCQSANAKEFQKKVKDYCGNLDATVLLGFFMTIQRRVEMLGAEAKVEEMAASAPVQGGLLQREGFVNFRPRHSALGLDRLAKEKRKERELAKGPVAALALDADPLSNIAKPKLDDFAKKPIPKAADEGSDGEEGDSESKRRPTRAEARSRSRSAARPKPKPKPAVPTFGGPRATSADLWGAGKKLRDEILADGDMAQRQADKVDKDLVGRSLFFKGNKSAVKKDDDGAIKTEPGTKPNGRADDMQFVGITEEVMTKDEIAEKIKAEAEIDKFEDSKLDRDWYDAEETGTTGDGAADHEDPERLAQMEEKKKRLAAQVTRVNVRTKLKNEANEMWENNRLRAGGLGERKEHSLIYNDGEDEKRTVVVVRDTTPPFLDGRVIFTTQTEPVCPVKDPTSDMATLAKAGSKVLKQVQEDQEQGKFRKRFWEIQGTAIGKALGVKEKTGKDVEDDDSDDEFNHRKGGQYGEMLKNQKTVAASDFSKYRTIDQQRKSLPVYKCREEMLDLIREHQILVIVGETGSGKTTQLTQYLHEAGYTVNGQIGCTQPRRVAAVSVAKRVADEMGCELGTKVGYAIRFEDVTNDSTIIKYMTDGVLLREVLMEQDLDKYCAVIMDEAHERSLNTDVLFGILRGVVARRNDFKLIVTSATMDADKFADFFGKVPVFIIPGRTFTVETFFARCTATDYVDAAVQQALAIHVGQPEGDILIFMTGQGDIEATCVLLADRANQVGEDIPGLTILPIYSQLPADMQAKIFESSDKRKIVVATNIAETSLTLDGVKYVIDTGYCKLKMYNAKMGMDSLQVNPISQANANQRRGRAGRTGPGMCWRLYTESAYFSEMLTTTIPEIQRTNLANVVLLLKSMGVKNLLEFGFMDPPPQDTILSSMFQLWMLGSLDNLGDITPLGSKMAQFPLDPPLSKMLIVAEEQGCSSEMMTVVSMLSVPSIFFRPKDRADESDAAREKFFVPESDHCTMLNVYQQWALNGYSAKWCTEHFVHQKSLKKVREVRGQMEEIMQQQRLQINTCGTDWDVVRKSICAGYFHNASKLRGIGEYVNLRSRIPVYLHPTSALYGLGYTPDYIVYHEVMFTVKEYMNTVTAVEPQWLAEQGPMFFSTRETGNDASSKKKQEQEEQRQMEYAQKLRDDLDRQARQEEADRLTGSGGSVIDIGKRRPASKPLAQAGSTNAEGNSGSDSDGAAARRRRKATTGVATGGGGPKKGRKIMLIPGGAG